MTKVHCDLTTCKYIGKEANGEFLCLREEITLYDEACNSFISHTDVSEEYRETFWKRIASRKDGHHCREKGQGKRYEMFGLVFFTQYDDRWGTEDIWFTEKHSGLRIQGRNITEENAKKIREKYYALDPVDTLPLAGAEDVYSN